MEGSCQNGNLAVDGKVDLSQLVTTMATLETLVTIPREAEFIHILPIRLILMATTMKMRNHVM